MKNKQTRKVRLTQAQMGMLDDACSGGLEDRVDRHGKTFIEGTDDQLSELAMIVLGLTEEWHEELMEWDTEAQHEFALAQKLKCQDNLYDKLMNG